MDNNIFFAIKGADLCLNCSKIRSRRPDPLQVHASPKPLSRNGGLVLREGREWERGMGGERGRGGRESGVHTQLRYLQCELRTPYAFKISIKIEDLSKMITRKKTPLTTKMVACIL